MINATHEGYYYNLPVWAKFDRYDEVELEAKVKFLSPLITAIAYIEITINYLLMNEQGFLVKLREIGGGSGG